MTIEATKRIIDQMKAQGNQPGLIRIFKQEIQQWAHGHKKTPDGQALIEWLPKMQERPFYTARELVPLFPALALALGHTKRLQPQKSSSRLSNELHFLGLPVIQNADGSAIFDHPGYPSHHALRTEFFIIERIHVWRRKILTQEDFNWEFQSCSKR